IQGRLLQAPVSVTVPGTAQNSASTPLGLATGTITLRNTTSQPIAIPAGKQIQVNGTLFTFNENVNVPPATSNADGVAFGKADASLTSTVAGEQGNLKAGTLSTAPQGTFPGIPGLEGAVRIEQANKFAGGTNEQVKIVRVEDVNQVLPQAMSQLFATGVQALNLKVAEQPGWELPAATITPTIDVLKRLEGIQYTVLPPIGSVASDGNFSVEVRSEFRAIASNKANGRLDDQILKAVQTQLSSTRNVDPKSTFGIKSWTFRGQNLVVDATVQPPNQTATFPAGFLAALQNQIANKPRDEAEQTLQQMVNDHKLARMPNLPTEWQTIPANVKLVQATQ
nr:hypothetical protein [Herpetosiphonaceae bacterium]